MPIPNQEKFDAATKYLARFGSEGAGTMSAAMEEKLRAEISDFARANEPHARPAPGAPTILPEVTVEGDPSKVRGWFPHLGVMAAGLGPLGPALSVALGEPEAKLGVATNAVDAATFGLASPLVRASLTGPGAPPESQAAAAALEQAKQLDEHPMASALMGGLPMGGALLRGLGMAAKTGTAAVPTTGATLARDVGAGAAAGATGHVVGGLADYGADAVAGTDETLGERVSGIAEGLPGAVLTGAGFGLGGGILGALASKLRTGGDLQRAFARNEDFGGSTDPVRGLVKPPGIQERIYNKAGEDHPVDLAVERVRGPATEAALGEDAAVQSRAERFKAAYNGSKSGAQAHPLNEVLTGALEELRANKSLEGGSLPLANNPPLQGVIREAAKIKVMDGDAADAFVQANPGAVKLSLKEARRLGLAPKTKAAPPQGPSGLPMPAPAPAEAPVTIPDAPGAMADVMGPPGSMPAGPPTDAAPPLPGRLSDQPALSPTMPSPVPAAAPGVMIPPPPAVPAIPSPAPRMSRPTVVISPRKGNAATLERIVGLVDQAAKAGQKTTGNIPAWVERLQRDIRSTRLRFGADASTADAPAATIEVAGPGGQKTTQVLPAGSYAAKMHQIGEEVTVVQDRNANLGLAGQSDPESAAAQQALGKAVQGLGSGQRGLRDTRKALDFYGGRDPELAALVNDLKATNNWETLQPSTQLRPGTTNNPTTIGSLWNALKYRLDPIARGLHDFGTIGAPAGVESEESDDSPGAQAQGTYDTLKAILDRLRGLPKPAPGAAP